MAAVYLARDDRLDRLVALKVLAPALAADEGFRTRFLREDLHARSPRGRSAKYGVPRSA